MLQFSVHTWGCGCLCGMWVDGDLFMGRTGKLWEEAAKIYLRFLLKWIRKYLGSLYNQAFMRLKDTSYQNCFDTSFSTNISPEIRVLISWFWRQNRTDAQLLNGLESEKKPCEPWTGSWFLVIIYTFIEQMFIDYCVLVSLVLEYTYYLISSHSSGISLSFILGVFKKYFWICFRWCGCLSNGEWCWLVLHGCKTKH